MIGYAFGSAVGVKWRTPWVISSFPLGTFNERAARFGVARSTLYRTIKPSA
jgi:hypothetical protein